MTIFIPEWSRVSGRNLNIKRILNSLGEEWVVRRPIRNDGSAPDLLIEHHLLGWLAIAIDETSFDLLDPGLLFDGDSEAFECRLTQFFSLEKNSSLSRESVSKLVLMWSCSSEQTRVISAEYFTRFGIRLLSKDQFLLHGKDLIPRLLSKLDDENSASLRSYYFPEAEIPAVCTTRRDFNRDNSARLTRFFLDVQQEWASKLDLEPPYEQSEAIKDFSVRLVNGVAGSGKTLIAINRALLLSEIFPQQKILMLIHNTPIVADIKDRLHQSRGEIPNNLEITTFCAWASQQWKRMFKAFPRMPQRMSHIPDLIEHYRVQWPDFRITTRQLLDEFDFINAALIPNETKYLDASRAGQGFALRPPERRIVWAVYEAVTIVLSKEGLKMWSAIPHDICLNENRDQLEKYRHILIDEAQFFAPSWFELVKFSLESDGRLFLCADPNQGFMKNRLSWKSVGLDVSGRTKKLRRSYRTTQSILKVASHILSVATKSDPEDYLEPDFEGMDCGEKPILTYADSPQDIIDRIANEVASAVKAGVSLTSMLIIYGNKIDKYSLVRNLGERVGEEKIWWLNRKEHKKIPPHGYGRGYLRIVNIDSATGLEGNLVILAGVEDLLSDGHLLGLNDDELVAEREEKARKLYMGITRASQKLLLLSSQQLPSEIEGLFSFQH